MKPIVNALTLLLLELTDLDMPQAKLVASDWVEENAELFTAPAPFGKTVRPQYPNPSGPADETEESIRPSRNRLSQSQVKEANTEAALARGVGLCPNCQQSNADHLPGCARATGYDMRSVTAQPLPPVG